MDIIHLHTAYEDSVSIDTEEKMNYFIYRNYYIRNYLIDNDIIFPMHESEYTKEKKQILNALFSKIEKLIFVFLFKNEDSDTYRVQCISDKINKTFDNEQSAYDWIAHQYYNYSFDSMSILKD